MNKTFVLSVVAVFVTAMILGALVHHFLLGQEYMKLAHLFRTPEDQKAHLPFMLIAHLVMAIGWTWIYRMGRENKPWLGQGIRFGIAMALICTIPMYLIYFAVQPYPSDMVALQITYDTICSVILGMVVAAVNRDPLPARV
ncbi:MAG: DUF1761 domain-containing protein [Burkholderiales bacterium]|nr:DUF1761 domain-containing protein [Burkholderiales bacterium]